MVHGIGNTEPASVFDEYSAVYQASRKIQQKNAKCKWSGLLASWDPGPAGYCGHKNEMNVYKCIRSSINGINGLQYFEVATMHQVRAGGLFHITIVVPFYGELRTAGSSDKRLRVPLCLLPGIYEYYSVVNVMMSKWIFENIFAVTAASLELHSASRGLAVAARPTHTATLLCPRRITGIVTYERNISKAIHNTRAPEF